MYNIMYTNYVQEHFVAKEAAQQAAKEGVQQAVKEGVQQAAKEVAQQAAKEVAQNAAKEAAQQAAKEVAQQAAKEGAQNAAKEGAQQAAKEGLGAGLSKNIKELGKNALVFAKKNPMMIIGGIAGAGIGVYSAVEAKQIYDKKKNAKFTIKSITKIDSNIINIKFDNIDNVNIDTRDQIILKNTNTIPILNEKYSIYKLISNNEIEAYANITSNGTSGEMSLDVEYLKEFIKKAGQTTGDIIKDAATTAGDIAGDVAGVAGKGLLEFISSLLGTTPENLKWSLIGLGSLLALIIGLIILFKFTQIMKFIKSIFI